MMTPFSLRIRLRVIPMEERTTHSLVGTMTICQTRTDGYVPAILEVWDEHSGWVAVPITLNAESPK